MSEPTKAAQDLQASTRVIKSEAGTEAEGWMPAKKHERRGGRSLKETMFGKDSRPEVLSTCRKCGADVMIAAAIKDLAVIGHRILRTNGDKGMRLGLSGKTKGDIVECESCSRQTQADWNKQANARQSKVESCFLSLRSGSLTAGERRWLEQEGLGPALDRVEREMNKGRGKSQHAI